jgi:U2 small nuclear ribonucleoprotein B''
LAHADHFTKQIVYAKGQSQIIPKLRGTFEPPTTAIMTAETTDLQKSIFNAPPSSIPSKPAETNGLKSAEPSLPNPPHGVKRPRDDVEEEEEEEEEEDADEEKDHKEADEEAEDAPMEEDDESDAPMEASSDED